MLFFPKIVYLYIPDSYNNIKTKLKHIAYQTDHFYTEKPNHLLNPKYILSPFKNRRSFMKSLRKKTDHELIHQFRDGDLHALEALYCVTRTNCTLPFCSWLKTNTLPKTFSRTFLSKLLTPFVAVVTLKKENSFPGQCVLHTTYV